MAELKFQSSLSEEEIENNFRNVDFFSGVMEGLEEVLAYENAAHTYRYGPKDYEGSVDSVPASPVASECYR